MTDKPPAPVDARPVAIIGAGTLGRHLATVFAGGGSDVSIFDVAESQLEAARDHVAEQSESVRQILGLGQAPQGRVTACTRLEQAVAGAWMVIEAVPEQLELKRTVFSELDSITDADTVLASNSSSLPSSQLITHVAHPERVLNTHYYQPTQLNMVELMSCGKTDQRIIDTLLQVLPAYGLVPFHVRRESDGFIFNRIWAAIKRECLMVVEEGVAEPQEIDEMWRIFVRSGRSPFEAMDRVGLDVVLAIEEHYAAVRPGLPVGPRKLLRNHIDRGRLGTKTGRGFYDYAAAPELH
jgi:3-hydroxybutyryl-CoA dehydrogenase